MLQAPTPRAINQFSVQQLLSLLELVAKYMDPGEEKLLKLGYDVKAESIFFQELSECLQFEDNGVRLNQRVTAVLGKIKAECDPNLNFNHLWGRIFKFGMQNSNLINQYDVRVAACWQIFLIDLKLIFNKHIIKPVDPLDRRYEFTPIDPALLQGIVFRFMGQLIRAEQHGAVKAFHQFFYVANKIIKDKVRSGMDIVKLAPTLGPCLLEPLKLQRKLCQPEVCGVPAESVLQFEFTFMRIFSEVLLMHNIFELEYSARLYQQFSQSTEFFQPLCENFIRVIDPCWSPLSLQSPRIQDTSKLDALMNKLSLSKKKETPSSAAENAIAESAQLALSSASAVTSPRQALPRTRSSHDFSRIKIRDSNDILSVFKLEEEELADERQVNSNIDKSQRKDSCEKAERRYSSRSSKEGVTFSSSPTIIPKIVSPREHEEDKSLSGEAMLVSFEHDRQQRQRASSAPRPTATVTSRNRVEIPLLPLPQDESEKLQSHSRPNPDKRF
ncbi:MAG: hypothetical protein HYX61_01600 [Gammaproteobacteria bacterium]|nr:hypothetical protein [Gammaproteobacteria bacterium]